jgi:putative nucleotidyltransferase with HDIG domain
MAMFQSKYSRAAKALQYKFTPIHLETLRLDTILDFDLYVKQERQMTLYRSADLPFTEVTQRKLLEHGIDVLYVSGKDKVVFQRYLERNLDSILTNPNIPQYKKAGILYESSKSLIEELFENPTYGENIRRSKDLVENTIEYLLQGREAFLNLLKITNVNYSTYSHSVNVCTLTLSLAQQAGYTDSTFLYELGVGALLHDIGKSKVSERILSKPTRLSLKEFEIVKRHPQWGIELLRESDEIPEESYFPVIQHHERGNRRGYPHGLDLQSMHIFSRIVAIVDSFDAMTSERVYQEALSPFDALRIMYAESGAYDPELMRCFTVLLGPDNDDTPTPEDSQQESDITDDSFII